MKNNHKTSGIVLIVLGGVMLLGQLIPSGFWSGFPPFWKPLLNFFDSAFVWRVLFCALGILWLVGAARKQHYTQMCFAIMLTLASLRNLLHLGWIPFWPFVPAIALVATGGLLLYSITKDENTQPPPPQFPYTGTAQGEDFDEPPYPKDNWPGN